MRWWFIACAAWCIDSWRWRETEFIMQLCFLTKQCLHLRARLMRTRHMWIIATLRRWTQQQHQIVWSLQSIMHQQLLKHAEINMYIKSRELSLQHRRRKKSRRSRRDKRCSDNDVMKNVHLKKMSRLRKHVSMISVSANAATYHDDDDDDVDIAMSFMLAHELTCITTMLQRKKLISWAASYAKYTKQISCFVSSKEQYSWKSMLRRNKKKRKKERKQSWRVDINNLALTLFMLVSMINHDIFIQMLKRWKSYDYAISYKKTIQCYEDSEIESLRENAVVRMHLINYEQCMSARLAREIRSKKLASE